MNQKIEALFHPDLGCTVRNEAGPQSLGSWCFTFTVAPCLLPMVMRACVFVGLEAADTIWKLVHCSLHASHCLISASFHPSSESHLVCLAQPYCHLIYLSSLRTLGRGAVNCMLCPMLKNLNEQRLSLSSHRGRERRRWGRLTLIRPVVLVICSCMWPKSSSPTAFSAASCSSRCSRPLRRKENLKSLFVCTTPCCRFVWRDAVVGASVSTYVRRWLFGYLGTVSFGH